MSSFLLSFGRFLKKVFIYLVVPRINGTFAVLNLLKACPMKHFFFSFFFSVAITSTGLFMLSCSDNDDNTENNVKPSPSVFENEADTTNLVSMVEKDGIIMSLCLLNSAGDSAVTFSEGEEIIFDLKIENTTEKDVSIPDGPSMMGYDTFRVYTVNGEDCGVSWSYITMWEERPPYLFSSTSFHYQCPWYSDDIIKATSPFLFNPSRKKLTKGSYYTEAYCHINDETTLYCKIHFSIK